MGPGVPGSKSAQVSGMQTAVPGGIERSSLTRKEGPSGLVWIGEQGSHLSLKDAAIPCFPKERLPRVPQAGVCRTLSCACAFAREGMKFKGRSCWGDLG